MTNKPNFLKNYIAGILLNYCPVPFWSGFNEKVDSEVDALFQKALVAAQNNELKFIPQMNVFDSGTAYHGIFEFNDYEIYFWNENRWYAWADSGVGTNLKTGEVLRWNNVRPSAWTILKLKPYLEYKKIFWRKE